MERLIDNLYYLLGWKGKCYACGYKDLPVYCCLNPNCFKKYCLDCYYDNVNKYSCKKCEIYEWSS